MAGPITSAGSQEFRGFWWRPGYEDRRVPGILTFSDEEGIRLDLIGVLADRAAFDELERESLILGESREGELLSLADCQEIGFSPSLSGAVGSQRWMVATLYVGAHFLEESDIRCSRISIQFTHLRDFVGRSGLSWEPGPPQVVRFTKPDEIRATLNVGEFFLRIVAGPSPADGRRVLLSS